MGNRKKYYFSVVSYIPDFIRGERLNIGLLFFDEYHTFCKYILLPETTSKVHGLLSKQAVILFKELTSYLNHLFSDQKDSLAIDITISGNNLNIANLPEQIVLSDLEPVVTSNPSTVFNQLVDTYIGNGFFKAKTHAVSVAKNVVKTYLERKRYIENNVISRPSFKLAPNSPFKYTADYAYLTNKTEFNVINLMPSNEETLERWYQRNVALSSRFESYGKIVVLYDSDKLVVEKKQIIDDLASNSKQVISFEVGQNKLSGFDTFAEHNISQSNKDQVRQYIDECLFA